MPRIKEKVNNKLMFDIIKSGIEEEMMLWETGIQTVEIENDFVLVKTDMGTKFKILIEEFK